MYQTDDVTLPPPQTSSPCVPSSQSFRDPLQVLVKQYIAAHQKGGAFIQVPAAVVVDGERRYGHPLTCDWAIGVQQLMNMDVAMKAKAASAGLTESTLLAYTLFSDKTNIGVNLNAYPVMIGESHSDAHDIHAAFASGQGIIAYIPIEIKNEDAPKQQTARVSEMHAECFREVRPV